MLWPLQKVLKGRVSSAERNNRIFGLFVSNGDIRMFSSQQNICLLFYSLTFMDFSSLLACFLLHNGYLPEILVDAENTFDVLLQ